MTSRFHLSKVAARLIGFGLGTGWAILVVTRYFSVDNGFAFGLIRVVTLVTLLKAGLAVLLLLAGGALLGYAARPSTPRHLLIGAICLATAGLVAGKLGLTVDTVWQSLNGLPDGTLATLVIAGAAIVGAGFSLGLRVSRQATPLWLFALCLALAILFISLLAGAMSSLLALIWLFLLAEAIGAHVLKWINRLAHPSAATPDRAGLLNIAVGLAVLMFATLGLGLVGATTATDLVAALLLASVLCLSQIKSSLMHWAAVPWRRSIRLSAFEIAAVFMLAALFCIFWIGALAPEMGADALGGRVAAPAIWLRDGRVRPLPEIPGSYGTFGGEIIYLLVLPLIGFQAAKIVQVGLAVVLVGSVYTQVIGHYRRRDAALWLFAFWGSTMVWPQMFTGSVDLFQVFFYYASILALRFWLDEPDCPLWLITAGILGAAATIVKLNGAGSLIIVGLVVAGVTLYRSRSAGRVIRHSSYWGVPAALCLFPWLVRSYALTGNPVFPFANSIFKSPLAPLELTAIHFGVGLKFPEILTVPWGIFFDPLRFVELGTYHPLILACAILGATGLAWTWRKDWLWLVAGVVALVSWLVTEQNTRYSLYAVFLLWLALGIGLSNWFHAIRRRKLRSLFQGTLLAGLVWGFGMQALRPSFWIGAGLSGPALPIRVVFGSQTPPEYLTNSVPTYACAQWLNRHYGANAKVWQVPGIRDHLYFDAQAFSAQDFSSPFGVLPQFQPLNAILSSPRLSSDYAAIQQSLIAAGLTHLLYDPNLSPWMAANEADRQGILSLGFEQAYLQLECADRGLRLYKVRPAPLPAGTLLGAGPELLSNVGFEVLDSIGQPANWSVGGRGLAVKLAGNTLLRLEDGSTAFTTAMVGESRLYELTGDFRASTPAGAGYIQVNWLDASNHLRLFWRQPLAPTPDFVAQRFLQTAPAGVQTAVVYVSGSGIDVDNLSLHEIHP